MTNAELIAKIKVEIDKLYGEYKDKFHQCGDQYHLGLIDGLDMAERVLDTLESKKPMNPDEAMKELDEKIALVKRRGTWDGVDVDKYMDEVRGREPEKPKDLEEAADDYIGKVADDGWEWETHDIVDAFIAGAKWQAEQLLKGSPLPEDTVLFNKGVAEGRRLAEEEQADLFTIVALDAAQRAQDQMMKDAEEGLFQNTPFPTICLDDCKDHNFKDNQKVRIIIVKEDEK